MNSITAASQIQARPAAPATVAPAGADPVAAARAEIARRLEGTGVFGQGTQEDSRAILDQFRGLGREDASRLTRELAAAGKLDDVARMTTDGTALVGDGVSAGDRRDFFVAMAGRLDGAAAAELSRAFGGVDRGDGTPGGRPDGVAGADYAREFGRAVADRAAPADKIAFVRALAPATVEAGHDSQFDAGLLTNTIRSGNPQAGAVGDVLGTLRGAHAQEAFAALDQRQMQAVFAASIGETTTWQTLGGGRGGAGAAGRSHYDTAGYDRIATAAASVPDAHVKAQVFAAGTATIRAERIDNEVLARMVGVSPDSSQGAVAGMANGLARIIDSDPHGVIRDLREFVGRPGEARTEDGTALSTYAKAMIQSGEEGRGRLGAQLGLIAAGDGRQADATAAFNLETGGSFDTAESLGYFVGAVAAGSKAIDTDLAEQRELITGVLQSGLSIVDKGVGNNPAAAIAKDWLGSALGSMMQNPGADLASDLFYAAVPDQGGYATARSGPFAAFQSNMAPVQQFAKP